MSKPVDVLAVINAAVSFFFSKYPHYEDGYNLREARDAVAELIEALSAFDGMDVPAEHSMLPRLRRLRAAYQRVQGVQS